jgi:uncharacterized cupredoxin-like copper-binding protein
MRSCVKRVLIAAAVAGPTFATAYAAETASVVNVQLVDQGGAKEMPNGLGMNMGGDMAKATMGVKIDASSVTAGQVTFNVVNNSKDMVHELIVGHLDNPAKQKLPYVAGDLKVDEEGSDHLGEVSELDPGKSGALILTLKPGTYILYCNVAGHYMAGMWTELTVK